VMISTLRNCMSHLCTIPLSMMHWVWTCCVSHYIKCIASFTEIATRG
jgi:hypothetical protein